MPIPRYRPGAQTGRTQSERAVQVFIVYFLRSMTNSATPTTSRIRVNFMSGF
jgi:hypothetical protein